MFFDQEETGLNGSKAFFETCMGKKDCPELLINVDLAAHGNQIFAASSNVSHFMALHADNPASAATAGPEKPMETLLLNAVREAAATTDLDVVQGEGGMASDQSSAQFHNIPPVGFSLLREDQPQELMRIARATGEVYQEGKDIDWGAMRDARAKLFERLDEKRASAVDTNDLSRHEGRVAQQP